MGNEHEPSEYRKILRHSKSGKTPPENLIQQARDLEDPYYRSLALHGISRDRRLDPADSKALAAEAIGLVEEEQRPWRRAELIVEIARKSGPEHSLSLIRAVETMEEPKARMDAISGICGNIGCGEMGDLLELALENEGRVPGSVKPVIKSWVGRCETPGEIIKSLENARPADRVKLLGYLHLQMKRKGIDDPGPLKRAVAVSLEHPESLELLKYLAVQSEDAASLETVASVCPGLAPGNEQAALLVTLAGNADKAGRADLAMDWFNTALEILEEMGELEETAATRLNLAKGLERLGQQEMADRQYKLALEGADDRLKARVERAMGHEQPRKEAPRPKGRRHVLALQDTYQGKLSSSHIRAVARAAPLCVAYGLDLALLDFPTNDLKELAKRVAAETNVGKGGAYLMELLKEGRIMLISEPGQAGVPVATTSGPAEGKGISLEGAAERAGGKRLCVVMGLGRKGLPKRLLDSAEYHVEVTGSGIALETSTAMGIIAQQMGVLPKPKI